MISGASEEELDIASARADIMIALNEKYGNYGLLNKLDKYQVKEQQQLISFLEGRKKRNEKRLEQFCHEEPGYSYCEGIDDVLKEVLDFVNKGGKDE